MSKFQEYTGASFSEDDVENYLEELAEKGWGVFKHHNSYVIVIDDERQITTSFNSYYKEWSVGASDIDGKLPFVSSNPVASFQQFKMLCKGGRISRPRSRLRSRQRTPSRNNSRVK